jgi:hypothetical protein
MPEKIKNLVQKPMHIGVRQWISKDFFRTTGMN